MKSNNNLDINKRILQFVAYKKLTDIEFSLKLKYDSPSELSRVRNGHEVKKVFLSRLFFAFPELNREWIMDGVGDIELRIASDQTGSEYKNNDNSLVRELNALNMVIQAKDEVIRSKQREIDAMERAIKDLSDKLDEYRARSKGKSIDDYFKSRK